MKALNISSLGSGGLITNYHCVSRCGHCLYACGPRRTKDYIDPDTARANLETVRRLGCPSVHIGGGEPLLRPEKLKAVLEEARAAGVGIDYVETSSGWFTGHDRAVALLRELRELGAGTLLVSMSPFHNEHIPFHKVLGVLRSAREAGVGTFPWTEGLRPEVEAFDTARPHSLDEYRQAYGDDYVGRLPQRYWTVPGGRALATFAPYQAHRPAEAMAGGGGCRRLADTGHFHLDLYGSYVPGLCSGLAIRREDLGAPLPEGRYPVIERLYAEGVKGLMEWASAEHGFTPDPEGYTSACHLCHAIRDHLARHRSLDIPDLQPREFYDQLAAEAPGS